jgi:dTDP-4-dehydrorhamnose reductase
VIRSLRDQTTLRFVDDQVGSPTSAADLAARLFDLLATDASGIVHATNRGAVSWFGFVREVLIQIGVDPQRVQPITTADLDPPRPAARPANSVLVSERLHEWNLAPLRTYEVALADVLERLAAS